MTGSSHSTGLRYVSSRMITTTATVLYSSVPSMPLNAWLESAALPAGPVMCTASPGAPAEAVCLMDATISPALDQPSLPRSNGMITCAALPSADGTAVTVPSRAARVRNDATSAATLALSAGVSPAGRSYTTTAGSVLGEA